MGAADEDPEPVHLTPPASCSLGLDAGHQFQVLHERLDSTASLHRIDNLLDILDAAHQPHNLVHQRDVRQHARQVSRGSHRRRDGRSRFSRTQLQRSSFVSRSCRCGLAQLLSELSADAGKCGPHVRGGKGLSRERWATLVPCDGTTNQNFQRSQHDCFSFNLSADCCKGVPRHSSGTTIS